MHRGQIWLYNPNPTVGDEMGKTRPAIIVNNDTIRALRLKVIVPVTGWSDDYIDVPWLVKLTPNNRNGLSKISAADTFQVRSIAQERLIRQLGTLSLLTMNTITIALATVLDIKIASQE